MPDPNPVIVPAAVKDLTDLGRSLAAPIELTDFQPLVVAPPNFQLLSLEKYRHGGPRFLEAATTLDDTRSFIAYVNQFKRVDSVIFVSLSDKMLSFHAILDFHHATDGSPGRCAHVATFTPRQTKEWAMWTSVDRQPQSQEQFVSFLEEMDLVFKTPGGADLMELISTLEGHKSAEFSQGLKLANGTVQLAYEEKMTVHGGVGTGKIEVPTELVVRIAPFEGELPYEFRARLKHALKERKLVFTYESVRLHKVLRDAARIMIEAVTEGTQLPFFMGGTKPK